jgi:microsomal dipeptidase-like Zn-dependent dipeptidase
MSLGTFAGVVASGELLSAVEAVTDDTPPGGSVHRRVLADLHVHSMIDQWNRSSPLGVRYPAVAKLAEKFANKTGMNWRDCHTAGIDMVCTAHFNVFDEWASMPTDPFAEAPANTFRMMDRLEEELQGPAAAYARLARTPAELKELLKIRYPDPRYRIAVLHHPEGGHALGGSIAPLEEMARRGVAMIGVTHFFNKGIATSANSYPYFPDANARWPNQGLSEFGREVIQEMERLGIIVDITHATSTAVDDILRISKRPLVASHASARTLGEHPYSLYDEHIEQIVHDGGIIGVILYPYILSNYANIHLAEKKAGLRDVVRTIRYLTKLCGSHKQIGIGSDFGGYITGPKEMSHLSQVPLLNRMLLDEFGDEQIVEDIMANNVMRFFTTQWQPGI